MTADGIRIRPWPGGLSKVLEYKVKKALDAGVQQDAEMLAAFVGRPQDRSQVQYILNLMFPEQAEPDNGYVARDWASMEEMVRYGREIVAKHGWDTLDKWFANYYPNACACSGKIEDWHPICRCAMIHTMHENLVAIKERLAAEATVDG